MYPCYQYCAVTLVTVEIAFVKKCWRAIPVPLRIKWQPFCIPALLPQVAAHFPPNRHNFKVKRKRFCEESLV